jgi:hypothetical protein
MPPLSIGIFDQYLSSRMLLRHPRLFRAGPEKEFVRNSQLDSMVDKSL